MERFAAAYLAPENPVLQGPRISGDYLVVDGEEESVLPSELIPCIVKNQPIYKDIFHVKHEGKHYLFRCLTTKEYQLLCLLRKWFDPKLGLQVEGRPAFSVVGVEDIFANCILYPEDLGSDPNILAGLPRAIVEMAIQNSGWDSNEDIFSVQEYGRNEVQTNLITQMATFIRRGLPSTTDEEIYNHNMIGMMNMLARAEALIGEKFEIKKQKKDNVGSDIATKVTIREDLKALRNMGISGNPVT